MSTLRFITTTQPKRSCTVPPTWAIRWPARRRSASLDLFEREPRLEQVAAIESSFSQFIDQLGPAADRLQARCLGAILALNFDRPLTGAATRDYFVQRGVWLRPIHNVLYVCPPLTISAASLGTILESITEFTANIQQLPNRAAERVGGSFAAE